MTIIYILLLKETNYYKYHIIFPVVSSSVSVTEKIKNDNKLKVSNFYGLMCM